MSTVLETEINLPFITADASGPQHMVKTLTRAKLDQLVADLVQRTEGPCRQALTDSGLSASEIDEVIMVGGMSRMPAVQEKVKQVFGKEWSVDFLKFSSIYLVKMLSKFLQFLNQIMTC